VFPAPGSKHGMSLHADSESEWQLILKEEIGALELEPGLKPQKVEPRPGQAEDCDCSQGWDMLMKEEAEEIRRSCEEFEEATMLTPPTPPDSDEESSESSSFPKLTVWWAQWLFHAVRTLGWNWPTSDPKKPVLVMSACCGCSAESAVLQA